MSNPRTIRLEEIELEDHGFPGVMVMDCEIDVDTDFSDDWYIEAVYLGGKKTIPAMEKAIKAAIYDTPRLCEIINDKMHGLDD